MRSNVNKRLFIAGIISIFITLDFGFLEAQSTPPVASTQLFVFYSVPELSLHHFLYRWAEIESQSGKDTSQNYFREVDRNRLASLSEEDRKLWNAAVVFYREQI